MRPCSSNFMPRREAHLHQYIFDLVERLAARSSWSSSISFFALLDEAREWSGCSRSSGSYRSARKARVLRTERSRCSRRGSWAISCGTFDGIHGLFEVDEDAHVILHQLGGQADGVLRGGSRRWSHTSIISFSLVGHLAEAGRPSTEVVDLAPPASERLSDRDVTDGQVFVIVAVGGPRSRGPFLDAHLDLEFAALADRRDVHALIEDSEVRVFLDLRPR